jgi:hypothetical protein
MKISIHHLYSYCSFYKCHKNVMDVSTSSAISIRWDLSAMALNETLNFKSSICEILLYKTSQPEILAFTVIL